MSRRDRQREQILSALGLGQYARVLVLSREHLGEYPEDDEVRRAAEEAERLRGR